jgi:hypothetical protein
LTDALNGYLLTAAQRRRLDRRSRELSVAGLRELVDDDYAGKAARTALRCVEERGADPRLLLLVIESAQEGYFEPRPKPERDRQRRAQGGSRAG